MPINNIAKAPLRRRRGGQSTNDHPVCVSKDGFATFLDAQPPLLSQEGTTFRDPATSWQNNFNVL